MGGRVVVVVILDGGRELGRTLALDVVVDTGAESLILPLLVLVVVDVEQDEEVHLLIGTETEIGLPFLDGTRRLNLEGIHGEIEIGVEEEDDLEVAHEVHRGDEGMIEGGKI